MMSAGTSRARAPREWIVIRGASEHNLKSMDVEIPRAALTVVTGVSGSGKSSLVFDTLFREGQRRYLETFSSYARQFLSRAQKPDVVHVEGLSPAVAVDQRTGIRNPRSTVGTLTELHDYLRLLFSRTGEWVGEKDRPRPERRLFSFNTVQGACPSCNGLGVADRLDPGLLVADPSKSLREGALAITTPNGYIMYSQVTLAVLDQVLKAHGFSVDIPWKELDDSQRKIVLEGSDRIRIPYGKHPLESRLKWTGITPRPRVEGTYKGILPVMEKILATKRSPGVLRFVRTLPCVACQGTRLRPEALAVRFRDRTIADLSRLSLLELSRFFQELTLTGREAAIVEPIRQEVIRRVSVLVDLGLGYLSLERESTALSGGESQRIRLARQIFCGLKGILYVMDEPSVGLHPRDRTRLVGLMDELVRMGNTVVVVEHEEELIRASGWLVDMGPGAGKGGGERLYSGPTDRFLLSEPREPERPRAESRTRAFLAGIETIPVPVKRRAGTGETLYVLGARKNNLKNLDVCFRVGVINVITGVSGAGKSSLIEELLDRWNSRFPAGRSRRPDSSDDRLLPGASCFDRLVLIDSLPIGRTPRSNAATFTGVFDRIRDLFAGLPESKARGFGKGRFSFNVVGGRCECCEGAGVIQVGMHFLGNAQSVCDSCGGRRFNEATLGVRYRARSIHDVLEMSVDEACEFFADQPRISRIIESMRELGLGYLPIGQASTTLSGGEAQRVKLACELSGSTKGRILYVLDEPTTGLHSADVEVLLRALTRLVDAGNTLVIVEHDLDVIKVSDWVIDLGPESGSSGGSIVVAGPPERVAACPESFTGQALRPLLRLEPGPKAPPTPSRTDSGRDLLRQDPGPCVEPGRPIAATEPIVFRGVSTNNLKRIDVEIPTCSLTVVTGVSGSGKSSLAFDTLFAEGQQRFIDTISPFARRFAVKTGGAVFEDASGLTPTIAIRQRSGFRNPRSTVGTMTEIHDHYRLIFSRVGIAHCPDCRTPLLDSSCLACGFTGHRHLVSSMFSPNVEEGACTGCRGLGVVTRCDPDKLITDRSRSFLDGALAGHKIGAYYGDPEGQHTAILRAVGEAQGIDFSRPCEALDPEALKIALEGTAERSYKATWNYRRESRTGTHIFESTWMGFANYVEQEYQRKHADWRGETIRSLMVDICCPDCQGEALKPEYRSVLFAGQSIAALLRMTVGEALEFFERLRTGQGETEVSTRSLDLTAELRSATVQRLERLRKAGLSYLTLDRPASTLSGGEAQRILLSSQLGGELTGITYVLDEPTIGLHPRDTGRLLELLHELRDNGNTVVVVEHDESVIRAADHLIDLGPGAGEAGGRIVSQGSPGEVAKDPKSRTGQYLARPNGRVLDPRPLSSAVSTTRQRDLRKGITIKGARVHNLRDVTVSFPAGGVIAVTGVSGSGKSTLVFDVLACSLEARLRAAPLGSRVSGLTGCSAMVCHTDFDAVIRADVEASGASLTSTVATFSGLFDGVRDLFARTASARERGLKKGHFSTNSRGGRCETCEGLGRIKVSMDFLPDVWMGCEDCDGRRFTPAVLECALDGRSIHDVLEMSVEEAASFFAGHREILLTLSTLREVGLGYLRLGQSTGTLSGGELSRLRLATVLLAEGGRSNLYLFDEPTTGLHFDDVARLMELFGRLVDAGHTLVVIEHNLDVIRMADWVIDLGPEGGVGGGTVVVSGTVDQVARCEESHTGRALRDLENTRSGFARASTSESQEAESSHG